MTREVVKFKNDMNKLKFAGLGKSDMNLFMAICSKVKEQGDNIVYIKFDYLRQISHYTGHTIDGFVSDLKRMSKRIMAVNCEIITDNGGFDIFNLFQRFIADPGTQILTVKINPDFTWLLNEFADKIRGYTTFDLYEFVGLQSKYAKNLFRLLKQWRSTGQYIFNDIDDFREKMDVPKAYSNMRLMTKIIEPAVREVNKLDKSFINFQCEPLYARKRGKPLVGYKFTWEAENTSENIIEQPQASLMVAQDSLQNDIPQEDKDRLVNEFGAALTNKYIEHTKAYKCCNYNTIRQWILEDKEKKAMIKNQFSDFIQRDCSKEELDKLEHTLLNRK